MCCAVATPEGSVHGEGEPGSSGAQEEPQQQQPEEAHPLPNGSAAPDAAAGDHAAPAEAPQQPEAVAMNGCHGQVSALAVRS